MILDTERLTLRPWTEEDAEGLFEYAKDPNSLPNLAEILGVTVDELMQIKREAENPKQSPKENWNALCRDGVVE